MKAHIKKIILGLLLIIPLAIVGAGFGFVERAHLPTAGETLTSILVHPGNASRLLMASERSLFRRGPGPEWKRLLSLSETQTRIRKLILHPLRAEQVFLVMTRGIILADLERKRVEWILGNSSSEDNPVYALAVHPGNPRWLFAGTEKGLFQSRDGGKTWMPPSRWPETQRIELAAFLPGEPPRLFMGTSRELFFSEDAGRTFESGFSLPPDSESEEELEEESESPESAGSTPRFRAAAFSIQDPGRIWIGTRSGIFETRDGGVSWRKFSDRRLGRTEILDLVYSDSAQQLIAAVPYEISRFRMNGKGWEPLPFDTPESSVSLALDHDPDKKTDTLLVASGSAVSEQILEPIPGLNSTPIFLPSPDRAELFQKLGGLEPSAREIQQAAIRYGNLGSGRMRRWHWGSRMRAFVPSLSVGRDFSLSNNVDLDRGGTNDPDRFIVGPVDKNRGWSADLKWEFGDFFYSSDQASIDSREKLWVELRESLLSQVTRLYYERRRTQMEILFSPLDATPEEQWDRSLHLEELTGQIDALTNGYLSRRLVLLYQSNPELKALWRPVLEPAP